MKKLVIMFLLLSCIGFSSCDDLNKEHQNVETIVPFLIYENNDQNNTLEAKRLYWNITKGMVVDNNEVVYAMSTRINAQNFIEPIFWYDDTYIVNNHGLINITDNEFIKMADDISATIWGQNARMVACFDNNGFKEHEITVYKNGQEHKFSSSDFVIKDKNGTIGVFPSYIRYDNDTDEFYVISVDFSSDQLNTIYVFRSKPNNDSSVDIQTVSLSNSIKTNGNALPTIYNAVMCNNTYYFQSLNSLAYYNIDTNESGTLDDLVSDCRKIVEEGSFEPDFEKAIVPIGSYNNVLILRVPISTNTELEYLICAVYDGKIIGSMHLKHNGLWDIRQEIGDISSTFDVQSRELYVKYYEYITFPSA